MSTFLQKNKITLILGLFILIGIVFRFYNLNWGAPYYFHPDERNIASAITQLQFPNQMNPNFFAYGSLPIYIVYFSGIIYNYLLSAMVGHWSLDIGHLGSVSFEQAIIGLRILSATLSVLLIPLFYLTGKKLKSEATGIVLAFFALTSIGFIQYSHFGTYEMFLTFFTALLFLLCLHYLSNPTKINLLYISIISGILISSKVTNLALLPIPIFIIFLHNDRSLKISHWKLIENWKLIMRNSVLSFCFLLFTFFIFFVTNPYTFLDFSSFHGSMTYESNVALGSEPVFYTGEFFNTIPVVFQAQHVFPFLLTPFLILFILPALGYVFVKAIKPWNKSYILLFIFLAITFIPQAFFFVKWTRYMVPTLPFFYCILAIFFIDALEYLQKKIPHTHYKQISKIGLGVGSFISLIYAFAFFMTVYVEPDTRVAADQFAKKHISTHAPIVSEVYDLGITSFNADFNNISLFNFYDLDNNSPESSPETLADKLKITDYIILPSQRILKVRLQQPEKFPNGNAFYTQLLDGKLGFQKIYETPCDIWCTITYAGNPVFSYEETANVFDRPEVLIFKK